MAKKAKVTTTEEKVKKNGVTIKVCEKHCVNKFQDDTYGINKRVMNNTPNNNCRCTSCGHVQ